MLFEEINNIFRDTVKIKQNYLYISNAETNDNEIEEYYGVYFDGCAIEPNKYTENIKSRNELADLIEINLIEIKKYKHHHKNDLQQYFYR
jgi:hypothetical protein